MVATKQQVSTPSVYTAIANVMAALAKDGISKDRKNEQQGFKFRGIDDVYNALSPALVGAGLVITPFVVERQVVERQSSRGGSLFYVTLTVDYTFASIDDGSSVVVRAIGEAMDSGDKATNKAMSAAYKYACFQAFCIPTEGDNDADATTHTVAPTKVKTVGKDEIETITKLADAAGVPLEKICGALNVDNVEDIALDHVPAIVTKLQKSVAAAA